jgi:MSHA biogenesis protein MshO
MRCHEAKMRAAPSRQLPAASHRMPDARGFSLIEMIVVIVITGIIGASVAFFLRRPVEGYVDAARRAELSDIADTALRRITRDLRTALPNSIRIDATGRFIEFLQTSGGGRYRSETAGTGPPGDPLDFSAADGAFDVLGPLPGFATPPTESVVIYNLASSGGTANAYLGDNRATVASISASGINLAPAKQFPFTSPGKRFHVVQYAVTYQCDTATGELRRYWNYGIVDPQPAPPAGGATALLATSVASCEFKYTAVTQRLAVVALNLQVSRSGETVRLFQQVHVNNVP